MKVNDAILVSIWLKSRPIEAGLNRVRLIVANSLDLEILSNILYKFSIRILEIKACGTKSIDMI